MVQPGASPATYEPRPRQMAAPSKTQIYFAIGVPFEKTWLKKIAAASPTCRWCIRTWHPQNPHSKIINLDTPGKNHHGELDPHIWLSPKLVMTQARTILKALMKLIRIIEQFMKPTPNLCSKLADLDADLKKIFADKQGLQFLVFHPSWGYFARPMA